MSTLANPDVLTNGQAARMLGVAPKTLSKWCSENRISHWRIPGSKDRRFRKADVIRFALDNGIVLAGADEVVYAVTQDRRLVGALRDAGLDVQVLCTWFEAGLYLAERRPGAVVLDYGMGPANCRDAARALKEKLHTQTVVAVTTEDCADLFIEAYDRYFVRPCDLTGLGIYLRERVVTK